jgi:glutamine synthetase type III
LDHLTEELLTAVMELDQAVSNLGNGSAAKAQFCEERLVPLMQHVRKVSDELEQICDARTWPLPTYAQMLFTR